MTKEEVDDILYRCNHEDWNNHRMTDLLRQDVQLVGVGYVWITKNSLGKPANIYRLVPDMVVRVNDSHYQIIFDRNRSGDRLDVVGINHDDIIRFDNECDVGKVLAQRLLAM